MFTKKISPFVAMILVLIFASLACGQATVSPAAATATAMIESAQQEQIIKDAAATVTAMAGGVSPTEFVVNPTTVVVNTPIPPTAQAPAAQPQNSCGIAANLGPWAPSGVGETFEVTCNETNCAGTHVQLWWPAGSHQKWEKKEISVFVPAGLSIEVQNGAGKGWEYPLGCSLVEIQSQIAADNGRRTTDTSFFGVVDIDDLIKTGLVVVRFDRRGQ